MGRRRTKNADPYSYVNRPSGSFYQVLSYSGLFLGLGAWFALVSATSSWDFRQLDGLWLLGIIAAFFALPLAVASLLTVPYRYGTIALRKEMQRQARFIYYTEFSAKKTDDDEDEDDDD